MSDGAGSVAVQANARIDDLVDRLKALEDRVAELERAQEVTAATASGASQVWRHARS